MTYKAILARYKAILATILTISCQHVCAEHNKGHGNQFDQWAIGVHANAGLGDDAAVRAAMQASMAAHIDEPKPEPAKPKPTPRTSRPEIEMRGHLYSELDGVYTWL